MNDDDEEYVSYGTPLPEIEEESVLRKKAAKELQVRDEKGRQRFHGAFTGGFSAGYFNTVGTKEGWAPSTFVSSRSKVADRIQQNPEDFMDDEDFGDFGIATRRIHTTDSFQNIPDTSTHKRKYVNSDAVIPGEAPLKEIVQPVRESIGILILKKLGWRQGQGIGPRVKKQSAGIKVYGCLPFPSDTVHEEEDPMSESFTFAPKDTEEMFYKPKDDYFGLGYSGLSKQSVLAARTDKFAPTSTKSWLAKDKRKLTISGQAFGVGAYEEDDEDIFAKDDMSQYDFSDLALRGAEDSQKAIDSRRKGIASDVIEGFCLASQPPSVKKYYPPPELPRNFESMHLKHMKKQPEIINLDKSRHALSASDRSLILGEKKFTKVSSSVITVPAEKKSDDLEKRFESSSSSALKFRPFPNDVPKQQRYEEYLKLKKEGGVGNLVQPSSMTEWEKQQEIEEFAKASVLFQPLSTALKSRFESRSHLSVEHEVMSALEKIKKEKEEKPKTVFKKSLIGSSNRKTSEWCPVSLLCKRFNVPNPYPNSSHSGTQKNQKAKSVFDHLSFGYEASHDEKSISSSPSNSKLETAKTFQDASHTVPQEIPLSQSTALASESSENASVENRRPPIDFFKDIFENSSSDEDDNPDDKEVMKPDQEAYTKTGSVPIENVNVSQKASVSVESNKDSEREERQVSDQQSGATTSKKIGFGVFANLDLDALNQRPPPKVAQENPLHVNEDRNESSHSMIINHDNHEQSKPIPNETYGPELPPNYLSVESPASSTCRMEERRHSKHKSKHKHHKHKSKKKKKKKLSRRESSDSSSEDDLDIPPSLIIEKLKKLHKRKS